MAKQTQKGMHENQSDASQQIQRPKNPQSSRKSTSNKVKVATEQKQRKWLSSQANEDSVVLRKMPKRSASCSNFKEKSLNITEKDSAMETKKDVSVEDELLALRLTVGQVNGRPCRRLTDFIFHDSDGLPQPFEMSEVDDIFISGLILPLDEADDKDKAKGIRCDGFGRIEEWSISGYEDGLPVIWISTETADYDCLKPSGSFKKFYDHFYAKAVVCVEVYKKLSKSSGGDPNVSLDELLAGVVRAMSGMKCFRGGLSIRDFIVSQGDFIYNQLIGLDQSSKRTDNLFIELPVLSALNDECNKLVDLVQAQPGSLPGSLRIGPKYGDEHNKSLSAISCPTEETEDSKMARLYQDQEVWCSMKQKKSQGSASLSSQYYIKINEDEIAHDYPLPAYYKACSEETDEYIICDSGAGVYGINDLPKNRLHNWALYNSDARLVPLELLPVKPCSEIDVTIFGSGVMTLDDGSGYNFDGECAHSSSGFVDCEIEGIPVLLSEIKDWVIEFGSAMVSIFIRTDMSWFRLGKPSKQYAAWYERVLKTVRVAISILAMLKDEIRLARLPFNDVIKRVSDFTKDHPAFISCNKEVVERYVVVHGQIILQHFLLASSRR